MASVLVPDDAHRPLPLGPRPPARFLVVAALLALSLLAAAVLASNELRAMHSGPDIPPRPDATPYLGLTYVPLSHDLAARYSVEAGIGVLITEIAERGPAGAAGLRRGDILLSVDSVSLTPASTLVEVLYGRRPGDRVSFLLLREGKTLSVELILGGRQ